ncbi:MAG TPA: GAF domain-containing protein, partial [candidate division Zixibacteria bacterium]|nr:GAF domain-containing protein [candidate division Zixibacteria bacterium]
VIVDSLKQAIEFDAGGVFIINTDESEIESLYTLGYEDCSEEQIHLKYGQGLVGHVADNGAPIIVSNVADNPNYINLHHKTKSEMLVPLKVDGRVVGVFNIESSQLNAYDQNDLNLLTAFAAQAAISIERARLHDELVESNKIGQQLSIARDIQMSFLPKTKLTIKGYDITGENIPSGQVGGDYYDFIKIVDHQIGIAIGDVSGKGIPASLLMASFRASMIAEIRNNYSIRIICQKVNQLLYESMKPGNFVTAVYGVMDVKNHIFTFSNCGHDLPLLLRTDGTIERLKEGGPVLGVVPNATYEERPVYINKDDIVILYTDGVVEVFNDNDEQFGEERLIDIIQENRKKSTTAIRDAIYKAVNKFASKKHIFDDFTMIVLKRTI